MDSSIVMGVLLYLMLNTFGDRRVRLIIIVIIIMKTK